MLRLYIVLQILTLTGCATGPCWAQFPLDGKAVSSCKRGKIADEFCAASAGAVETFDYWGVKCKSDFTPTPSP